MKLRASAQKAVNFYAWPGPKVVRALSVHYSYLSPFIRRMAIYRVFEPWIDWEA